MIVEVTAPSNIALIKYMGKEDPTQNRPTNSSLSYTLNDLLTKVRITWDEKNPLPEDQWKPLQENGYLVPQLSPKSIDRFLRHFKNLKAKWNIEKNFLIESANNFPADCGLASSASSFAALTKAAVEIFQQINPQDEIGVFEMSEFSRRGSGSSCRSFFGPFALWHSEGVRPIEFPLGPLLHQAVIVEAGVKAVSSSEAHLRVATSPLFEKRSQRAEQRLAELILAFENQDWRKSFELCWSEFWDMHSLFETSKVAFGYMEPGSLEVLRTLRDWWTTKNDGPLVTMDAGANVHLLWRPDQLEMAKDLGAKLSEKYRLIASAALASQ